MASNAQELFVWPLETCYKGDRQRTTPSSWSNSLSMENEFSRSQTEQNTHFMGWVFACEVNEKTIVGMIRLKFTAVGAGDASGGAEKVSAKILHFSWLHESTRK